MNAKDVGPIVERVRPLLAGKPAAIQGAVLADLTAIWLAGHPAGIRERLLAMHMEKVRELVPVNARILGTY